MPALREIAAATKRASHMVTKTAKPSPAEHLEQRIRALDAEVEQIWAEYGDPAEALGRFLREQYGWDALRETYEEYVRHRHSFLFDDYDDEDDEDGGEPL